MAEARRHGEESVKLFVGQVPKQMSEAELIELFEQFAIVDEVNIIKDKITRASRGEKPQIHDDFVVYDSLLEFVKLKLLI